MQREDFRRGASLAQRLLRRFRTRPALSSKYWACPAHHSRLAYLTNLVRSSWPRAILSRSGAHEVHPAGGGPHAGLRQATEPSSRTSSAARRPSDRTRRALEMKRNAGALR